MTDNRRSVALSLRNRMHAPARLRFHSGRHLLWDTLVSAGAQVYVPDPLQAQIQVEASHTDPQTLVGSTVSTHLGGRPFASDAQSGPVRLVAKVMCAAGASGFQLGQEANPRDSGLGLLNLTGADVRFALRFLHTPFVLQVRLPRQTEEQFDMRPLLVSATIEGTTTAALAVPQWRGAELLIVPADADDEPELRWSVPTF